MFLSVRFWILSKLKAKQSTALSARIHTPLNMNVKCVGYMGARRGAIS